MAQIKTGDILITTENPIALTTDDQTTSGSPPQFLSQIPEAWQQTEQACFIP